MKEILDANGGVLPKLPRNAICLITGESPDVMLLCPLCNFDDDGKLCVPELCEMYREEGV